MKFLGNFLLLTMYLSLPVHSAYIWNSGGGAGIFFAIAVPIDLPHNNVFMSYNFEASYPLPRSWWKKPHGHVVNGTYGNTLNDFDDYDNGGAHHHHQNKGSRVKQKIKKRKNQKQSQDKRKCKPSKEVLRIHPELSPQPANVDYMDFFEDFPIAGRELAHAKRRVVRSLLSRTIFYKIITDKFNQHGFLSAEQCLLRLICEVNSFQVGEINGVLGTLMHTMFRPSSSMYETLPERYYMAELLGGRDKCSSYQQRCKRSMLDLITRPLSDFIEAT